MREGERERERERVCERVQGRRIHLFVGREWGEIIISSSKTKGERKS